ncbi:DUF3515 domain-containing protein [Nocardioides sp. W3-2-3]|uniref:DUF3515 domain-containing protein n=1 Tax=Nocardioides convexus TaxID=2712224 RepID=UPI00241852FB|nr:DUF3515 domain-containing protein [Nocardioides convexus]NHA01852.1 DUF3515 domain-containing protein [Nocardioides convexus]
MRAAATPVLLLPLTLLTACGGPVEVDVPDLTSAQRAACESFADALPETMADQQRVEIEPADAPAAAYGDPAIVVRCGVPKPAGFSLAASCETANGVGFFIPDEQYRDQDADLTITAAGYRPRVEVTVPAQYRPSGGAAAMSVLAPLVQKYLTLVEACD